MERKRLEKKNEKTKNTNCPSSFAQLTYRFCNIKMDKTSGTFCTHLQQPHHSEVGEGKLFHHSFSFLFFLLAGVYIINLNHPPLHLRYISPAEKKSIVFCILYTPASLSSSMEDSSAISQKRRSSLVSSELWLMVVMSCSFSSFTCSSNVREPDEMSRVIQKILNGTAAHRKYMGDQRDRL